MTFDGNGILPPRTRSESSNWATATADRTYVTEFDVDDSYGSRFPRRVVGSRRHEELWVPSEELAEFNRHIEGPIRVTAAFFGEGFTGVVPATDALQGMTAQEQLVALAVIATERPEQLDLVVEGHRDAVFLHLPFWRSAACAEACLPVARAGVLAAVEAAWRRAFPGLPLPVGGSRADISSAAAGR